MSHVLIVDDEPQLLRVLRINFQARHYSVLTAATGQEALDSAVRDVPDAVVLDLGLPDFDGVDIIHGLRTAITAPIIVLSGRSDAQEKVRALDAGADDYMTKPFLMDELFARLRAILRRPVLEAVPASLTVIGDHVIDVVATTVTGPAGPVRLTPTEWKIITLLLASPGRLVPGQQLLLDIWGPGQEEHGNYLRVYLAGLRRKLERDPTRPRHLITEPGLGYRYQP